MNRISALILDWAGTTVDFGSFAPTQIFVEAFRQAFDIEITLEEARVPMGLGKWQHIEALGKLPAVDFSAPIAGVVDTIATLRAEGLKIGSCSGYPRPVMEKLVPAAAAQGYAPDHWVATDDLAAGGRPGPWMALQNVITLGIDDVAHCVKVDDAAPGISEGLHAGMWSVGLAVSGNEFGATWEEY